ncbi:ATP-binding response regulator [Novosphingobium jiangmenense]|nr:hybrid sensor histidine kinase/response regulator [Novosphingobium jiangmenense]
MLELRRRVAVAEAANEAKSRFLANLSHEIRSPLNAIYGYAQLVERGAEVNPRDAARVIRRSAEHLTNLVEGLLDIASVEQGIVRVDNGVVRLGAVVEQVAEMFAPLAAEKGLGFACELPARLPEFVRMDERRVRQALINLVSNAVKFTQSGEVRIVLRWSGQVATIDVQDTGPGISKERQERIFVPYERAAGPDADRAGAGLGLAITSAIARMLGGELRLDSEPGRGSCFTLRFMASQVSGFVESGSEAARPTGYEGTRRTILLVDDDADHLAVLRTALGELGFIILQASNGQGALSLATENRIDAVICDVSMPGMSGWDVAARLSRNAGERFPVLMLSANAFERHGLAGQEADHDAFLLKPVDLGALVDALGRQLKLVWIKPVAESMNRAAASDHSISAGARERVERIRSLIRIGHVRGLEEEIKGLEQADAAGADLAARLFGCLDRFDLAAMARILEELPDEWR